MTQRYSIGKRLLSLLLCICMLAVWLPGTKLNVSAAALSDAVTVDPGTADEWETMMGTDTDGNRYAGRVWVDRSVYKDGDTVVLNSRGEAGSSFQVALEEDETFQVIFSALGSSMTTTETKSTSGPMDVVLVLDNSVSMNTTSGGTTRMQEVIEAANSLLSDLLADGNDVRLGIAAYSEDASTVLPFGKYDDGVVLKVNRYTGSGSSNGIITAYNNSNQVINNNYKSAGYANYTNTQAGFDLAMQMLGSASNTAGRKPVVILLTDGAANTAVDTLFDNDRNGTVRQVYYSNNIDPMIALSTLLSAAYNKASVEDHYGKAPMIYGIGVDLSSTDGSNAIINPKDNFNSSNSNANIRTAYQHYTQTWVTGSDLSVSSGTGSSWGSSNYTFRFGHEYPQGSAVTDSDIAANINYVDTYYPVASADLQDAFDQIYQELSSGVFNPISSSTSVNGGTGVDDTPLIYVDYIGQYMEIKEMQAVTLFGASYGITKRQDGTYVVDTQTGTNPTTNEAWNTAEDILISVTEEADGSQKLEIRINQEILPIVVEQVVSETVGNVTTSTITELMQNPLRVYYTIGLDSDILLPNGKVDVTKIQGYEYLDDSAGTVSFYGSQFGEVNEADASGVVTKGDSHAGFQPSAENRFYYHQANQGIFTEIRDQSDNSIVTIPDNEEYGIVWDEDAYSLSWMTYEDYLNAQDTDKVYTYVTYYHPTPDATDAATAAEEVTYLVYTDWVYLKESIAFYDAASRTYLNNGRAIPADEVQATVAAYMQSNPNAEIYAVLGVGSRRTSRLHNMTVEKDSNPTGTAVESYSPEYMEDTAQHNGNDVVVWFGNNSKLTVQIDTGIALTKAVTEAIGNADDTYALTVTVPAGVTADPVVVDENGASVASTYSGNVLTVQVKAGQTVYISGIPGGTECAISEIIGSNDDYYIKSQTNTVTVPLVSEALNGAAQFVPAVVTNAPNKYGDLTIIKDIAHQLSDTPNAMADKVFTFKVQLTPVPAVRTYSVDRANASAFTADTVTVADDGSFEVKLKDNESITILDLPEGTHYTVTETSAIDGYTNSTGIITGQIEPDGDHDAHFINTYTVTPIKPQITVTGQKVLKDENNTYTADEDFVFVLSQYTGDANNPYTTLATQSVKKGQSYSFDLEQLLTNPLGLGSHYFRVTEQAGSTPGMTYDATRGLFVIHVTDNGADGVLEYSVENYANTTVNGNTVVKDFTNTYDVSRTHADINITKTLDNETGVELPLDLFHFVLVNKADANDTYTVTTDASGKATIRISNLAGGTYEYTLSEVAGTIAGMDYDDTVYTVLVTVTNNGGVLTAVAEIQGSTEVNGDNTLDVSFRNTYELTSVKHTISGSKRMEGRDPVTDEFEFALYETDSSFKIVSDPIDTAKNVAKRFAFDEITYTKVGTYYYVVKENVGNVAGVTYDTTHYHITVHVGIDSQNPTQLAVTNVAVNKIGSNSDASGNIVFVNTYKAAPTQYTLSGSKILHGRAPRDGEFEFELYEGNTWKQTVTNKADGSFSFDAISYTQAGTYTYTIKEKSGNAAGVTYGGADHPVTVTVTVTDTNAVLSARADVPNTGIRFENTYNAADAQVTFKGTKALEGGTLEDNTFVFQLYSTDSSFDITRSSAQPLAEAKNVDGAFAFARTFSETGTYYFVIAEDVSDPADGIVYDRTQYKYVVQVSDIGDGQLRTVVTNVTTGVSTAPAASASVDAAFKNATFDKVAEKEVYIAADVTTQIDGKKVNAGDILTYFIRYTNYTGENVAVDIMDTIPNHTSYVEGSASHGGTYAGTHVNWVLNVERGGEVTVSFSVKVDETEAIVANTAVIRDGVNTYNTNEVVNHTVEEPLKKDVFASAQTEVSIDGKKVYAGEELLYQITFVNNSDKAVDIKITDTIPANTAYVEGSASNGGAYSAGVLVWEFEDVPAWASVTVTFKVKVDSAAKAVTIENEAKATDGTNQYTSHKVTNYTVVDEVKKEIFAAGSNDTNVDGKNVRPGDTLGYAITYKNTSKEKATVTITDTIPQGTAYVDGSADHGGVYNNGVITWTLDVEAGASVTVAFKVTVMDVKDVTLANKATVTEGTNHYTTNEVTNKVEPVVEEPTTPSKPEAETPETGDSFNGGMLIMAMTASAFGLVTLLLGKKKKFEC